MNSETPNDPYTHLCLILNKQSILNSTTYSYIFNYLAYPL